MPQDSRKTRRERRTKHADNGIATAPPPSIPRWKMTITPNGQEARVEIVSQAEDVTFAEVAFFVSKVTTTFIANGGSRLPTEREVIAQQKKNEIAQQHPAVRLFARDGEQLWLGAAAVESHHDDIKAAGWIDAGPAPEGVTRPCAYALDPEGVKFLWAKSG